MQVQTALLAEDQVLDALGAEGAGPTAQAVDLVTLGNEQFRQIRTVLTGDTGDQRAPLHEASLPLCPHNARPASCRPYGQGKEATEEGEVSRLAAAAKCHF